MSNQTTFLIGARSSRLSIRQTVEVLDQLAAAYPDSQFETRFATTQGDRDLESPLPLIGGKGVFTEELEAAILAGEVDAVVHSLKDLPVTQREGLIIGAVTSRAAATDVLISSSGLPLRELPGNATVGTSSLRRAAQILHARPDLRLESIRGNVETRIRKLNDPALGYDAIVLASAGLDRLALGHLATELLPLDLMLPAPGQGALAVQCAAGSTISDLLTAISHQETALATTAERAFLAGLGGGCSAPIAALGVFHEGTLHLRGRVLTIDGRWQIDVNRSAPATSIAEAAAVGAQLALDAIADGAHQIIEIVA